MLWGLAYKGQAGVELCLKLISDEIKLCMALAGTTSVKDINKEYLVKVSPYVALDLSKEATDIPLDGSKRLCRPSVGTQLGKSSYK